MTDTYRGHAIVQDGETWIYAETRSPVADDPCRACAHCDRPNTPAGHDGCMGTLPGVMNACCGHGVVADAYVQYDDGRRLAGVEALRAIRQPIDTIQPGDAIPDGCDPRTEAGGIALWRYLVPTLSEDRAAELHRLASAEMLPLNVGDLQRFIDAHAPERA